MARTLTDEDLELIARIVAGVVGQQAAPPLRPTYTPEQFAAEVLGGDRCTEWVRRQIRAKRLKIVTRRPYLIPRSEAERFIGSKSKQGQ